MSINSRSHGSSSGHGRRPRPTSLAVSDSVRRRLAALTTSQSAASGCRIEDAYNAALGVVVLAHRLQTRPRAGTASSGSGVGSSAVGAGAGSASVASLTSSPAGKKTGLTSSLPSLVKSHLSVLKDSESRLPHSFGKQLEQRMTKVLVGADSTPGYQDPALKRTFGAFLNQLRDTNFFQSITKGGRVEDFLLIFISKGTAVLRTGNLDTTISPDVLLDRHCALFLRLIASILKDAGWSSEKSPLLVRLKTMETQLYQHDPNIAISAVPEPAQAAPLPSTELKNIPHAQHLQTLFKYDPNQVQTDINNSLATCPLSAAMKDLKRYQTLLNLGIRPSGSEIPFCSDDFEHQAGYDAWKRGEVDAVNSLIVSIINHKPELAKSSTSSSTVGTSAPPGRPPSSMSHRSSNSISRKINQYSQRSESDAQAPTGSSSVQQNRMSSHVIEGLPEDLEAPFAFLPSSPNSLYKVLLKVALLHELKRRSESDEPGEAPLNLPKSTIDLLHLVANWWRVPSHSRPVLLLDVSREMFEDGELDVNMLEKVFAYIRGPEKCPLLAKKKAPTGPNPSAAASETSLVNKRMSALAFSAIPTPVTPDDLDSRSLWMAADTAMWKRCLEVIHTSLLRDLYSLLLEIYEAKGPDISTVMTILETYIYDDELCPVQAEELDNFATEVETALQGVARKMYEAVKEQTLGVHNDDGEKGPTLESISKFGKGVVRIVERVVKRMRKLPQESIMGVRPVPVLANVFVPEFIQDCGQAVSQVISRAEKGGSEISMDEGFRFYRELSEIRQSLVRADSGLMSKQKLQIEGYLRVFVDRWIAISATKVPQWIENSVNEDSFTLPKLGTDPTDEERHSVSSTDIFRILREVITTVTNLGWENPVQQAEFMTAISKIVCEAVVKYCQMCERMFTRELNQGQDVQHAQAAASQWERYSQMAREAWTNSKIEPYHFQEQSLVKLNNIEYILHELDAEERKMDVDSVSEILARHRPAKSREAGKERYVFTIKIIEAENLKPCDMNGLSDPYVVLGDEFQKRLAKTRVVYNNLNPRWEESVDIVTTGPLNVVATVWDWDALGDHDCVGRTSLKLDPNHFRDYVPREYWLQLDSQGRLLVRVSMEGERDDIEFYFGKAFRTLKRTERDMTRLITEKLSAYIRHVISTRSLRQLLQRSITSRFNSLLKKQSTTVSAPTPAEISAVITPLLAYFDANFALMNQTLTRNSMLAVMSRVWKEVLITMESLLVPPLSDEPSSQQPLTEREVDIVYKWLDILFGFFHAVDEETKVAQGVPLEILKSSKYHDLKNLAFFYFQPTEDLIQQSDRIASQAAAQANQPGLRPGNPRGLKNAVGENSAAGSRMGPGVENMGSPLSPLSPLSAVLASQAASSGSRPMLTSSSLFTAGGTATTPSPTAALFGSGSIRRHKSVLLSRNLGTMRRAKELKRKEMQAEPSDDMILRILRMRPDAVRYLKERARQKERLAAVKAAEMIVLRSLAGKTAASGAGGYNQEGRAARAGR